MSEPNFPPILSQNARWSHFAWVVAALFVFIGKAPAVSVNYIDGETRIAPIDANDAITLNILFGTATQSGVVSGDAAVYKTGQGTLTLSANNTYRGTTNVEDGTLVLTGHSASAAFNIVSGAVLELVPAANYTASTVFSGNGTLRKSGSVSARWAEAGATFALGSGSLIDVQAGTFVGGANANEDWTNNKSDLHVAEGAIFNGVEANVRVNVLTGSGIIRSGYSGAIYEAFTFGVDNGSGTFAGVLAANPGEVGRYAKTGSGTQILTGTNTHTGLMTVSGGTLQIGNGGTTGSLASDGVNNATLAFNRSNDITVGRVISGSGNVVKQGGGALTFTGSNTYAGGTTISAGTLQIGNGGTTGSLVGNITNQGALVFNRSDDVTYGAVISGSGTFTKQGAGTVALTGASTYIGLTTINEGTLQLGDGGATGSITGDVVNNATLAFNRTSNFTYAGVISGTGQVVNRGAGRVTLTGDNAYSGGTTFEAGTVVLGSAGALGSSGLLSFTGGTLQFGAANTTDYSARFSNAPNQQYRVDTGEQNVTFAGDLTSPGGTLSKLGTGRLTLKGENTYGGGTTFAAGTVMVDSAGALGSSGLLSFTGGTLQFGAANTTDYSARFSNAPNQQYRIDTGGQNVTFAGDLTSPGGTLLKAGGGTLTLTGANTYTGATTVGAGTLQIGNGGTAGSLVGNITNEGGAIVFNRSDDLTYAGIISGRGILTKLGEGTLTLTGANTYAEGTIVSAGTLRIQNSLYNKGTTDGWVTVGNGGTLDLQAQNIFGAHLSTPKAYVSIEAGGLVTNGNFFNTLNDLRLSGGELRAAGGQSATWPAYQLKGVVGVEGFTPSFITTTGAANSQIQIGNNFSAGTTRFHVSIGSELFVSAQLVNGRSPAETPITSSLNKSGVGRMVLTGNNTYTGITTIDAGTLQIGDGGTSGSVLGNITNMGALAFNRSDSVAYTGAISGSGTLTKLGAGMLTFTHAHTYSGPTTVSAGTLRLQNSIYSQGTIAGVVTVGSGGTLDLRAQDIFGNHTDNSNVRVTIEAGGLVTNGNFFNTFADLTLNGGELRAGGGEGEIWPAYQLKGTVSTGGSSASSITTTGASNSRIQIGNNNAGGFTTFDVADATGSAAADLTISAVLQNGRDSEASFVASGLMKTGEGTLRLTGTNTYTGATTIEAGTLVVDGSIADSSLTTIGGSGTLAGSGTVGAVAILDGGTISPGNSPGILNTGSETWNGGGSYVWELNSATGDAGTNWDLLNITGTLALDGLDAGNPFTIIVTSLDAADHAGVAENFDPAQSYTWTLVTASSGITGFGVGNFAIDTSGFANAPNSTRFSLSTDGNHLVLSYSAVPEPGAYGVALGIGLALLAIAGRRRK